MGAILSFEAAASPEIRYDGDLIISLGRSRYDTSWKNRTMEWSALLGRLSRSQTTAETHAEYMAMTKDQQGRIKDIGGFVGGHLKGGHRRSGAVEARQIVTLDLDFPPADLWEQLSNSVKLVCALAVYSTHKYTPEKPRLRLVIPLDRTVTPDEYEAIARKVAEKIGIDYFDDSTFQASRLMYWPSNSSDVEPFFRYIDAPWLKADEVLAEYPDWRDASYWPMSSRVADVLKRKADKQRDPLEKKGIVGAFCRAYTITEAISTFLSDIYAPTSKEDRYTYTAGSTAAGLVVYDGNTFAYSNHGTDPAGGQLCNSWDLVRIHRFGDLDEDAEGREGRELPSYKAMTEFAREDAKVRKQIVDEKMQQAAEDFSAPLEQQKDWKSKFEITNRGAIAPSMNNAVLIMANDPKLQGIRFNELNRGVEVPPSSLPWAKSDKYWNNTDNSQLYSYICKTYQVEFSERNLFSAFDKVSGDRGFNPLKDYVKGLPDWDGVKRVDTLLVDYLGAEDTPYVRAVTRKTLVGAIDRVLEPGCKFDTVLVLDGKPGIGKSTLLRKLGGQWFSDSLSMTDTRDKTAAEKLQGQWIVEIGEMQGTRKADTDVLKSFLSRQVDEYRPAYGRVVERRPRTAIICGTTNSTTGFLRDVTGNRRFWPVNTPGGGKLSVWDMTEETRSQIWAEALTYVVEGETPYLDAAMEEEAVKAQTAAIEYDDREGSVIEYLDTLLPEKWYDWDTFKRVDYFQRPSDELDKREKGTMQRTKVCALEIFTECFGRSRNAWRHQDGYEIAQIMARLPGWERTGQAVRIPGYGRQRVYEKRNK